MSLLDLPNEVFILIGDHIPKQNDVKALMITHRRMHDMLRPRLYATTKKESADRVLSWACQHGNVELAGEMLRMGANLKKPIRDCKGNFTPLTLAASQGDAEIVKLLLDHDLSIINETGPSNGATAILHASARQHLSVVKILLSYPELLPHDKIRWWMPSDCKTAHSLYCETPVNAALGNGDVELVEVLLADSRNKLNDSSLIAAVIGGNKEMFDLIFKRSRSFMVDLERACEEAAERGFADILVMLLEAQNADTKILHRHRGRRNLHALHLAVEEGHEAIFKILLGPKYKVNIEGKDITRLFAVAAEFGHVDIMELLLKLGADVNAKGSWGETPLFLAAGSGEEDAVKFLLSLDSVYPDQKNLDGYTPLYWAAGSGAAGVVRMLLEKGADPESLGYKGRTPLSNAVSNGKFRECLRSRPADTVEREHLVHILQGNRLPVTDSNRNEYGQLKSSVDFARYARSVESRDDRVKPTTHNALEVMKQLLALEQVNPDSCDTSGRTALSRAAAIPQPHAVELLLSTKRVDVNSKDKDGWTPLQWAKMGAKSWHKPCSIDSESEESEICYDDYSPL